MIFKQSIVVYIIDINNYTSAYIHIGENIVALLDKLE